SRAIMKGLLTPVVKDDVNFVNAIVLAKERGIRVTETTHSKSEDYLNLITVRAISPETTTTVEGTLFGKKEPRVVKINNFRVEMVPQGHLVLINNIDKPGAIGSIGITLGQNDINIDKMQVGQEKEGERNIIFLRTDIPIPNDVLEKLHALPLVKSVISFEL
ncbi:MAG: ACT domain-containing protein, partial [Deltaproteobacteria bacterium]|nr:ACT domain-containing protein [Deltaproteobacteria bacterium]